jgi:aminopeptidase N
MNPEENRRIQDRAALVLYQLGSFIGEETFWRAVRDFTARAGWRAVSLDDFRDSAEQAARRNLDRYFEEWFLQPGHPELVIEHEEDASFGVYQLRVRQVQDSLQFPTYDLETDVTLHFESRPEYRERVRVSSRDTTLRFGYSGRISFVRFDAQNRLLADVSERKPLEQWLNQAEYDPSVGGRHVGVKYLSAGPRSTQKRDALMRVAQKDASSLVRMDALLGLSDYASSGLVLRFLFERSEADPSGACRAAAIRVLASTGDPSAIAVFRRGLDDPSLVVVADAVAALSRATPASFWSTIEPLTELRSPNSVVELAILSVLEESPLEEGEVYIRELLEPANPARVRVAALDAYRQYSSLSAEWTARVVSVAQSLLSDRSALVRNRAREILERR